MKKGALLAVYVVIAAAVIGAGAWWASSLTQTQNTQTNTNNNNMNGLVINDTTVGTGTVAAAGDTVTVNYTGTLDDGTVFDSSLKPGRTPFTFTISNGTTQLQVIEGWDQGIRGMKVGGTRDLTIPPALGYGSSGAGTVIPPNATLHFTVTLLSVSTSTPAGQ